MTIKKPDDIPAREITDESTYLNRRRFIRAGIVAATAVGTGLVYRQLNSRSSSTALPPGLADLPPSTAPTDVDESIARAFNTAEKQTPFDHITHYNNFYEFTTSKEGVADLAEGFPTRPWTVEVGGLCRAPKTFDIDELLKLFPTEQRVYRMRCVEAWSMVIPWNGFALGKLLDRVEPLSDAKYVAFETVLAPEQMPGQRQNTLPWPYVEGLRIDEAMHPLTILATGIYGKEMPPQNGAPLRLVVPWKYGFKGIKSIVKIRLVAEEPVCTWNLVAPREYGFYANVNPEVDHPRWSQASERRLDGGTSVRPTLMFNGYAGQVAHLYAGMDLEQNF